MHALIRGAVLSLACQVAIAAECERRDIDLAQAWDVHSRVLTIDTHVDVPRGFATHRMDPGGFTRAQNDLPKMRAGGLDAAFLIVFTSQDTLDAAGYARARARAEDTHAAITRLLRAYPDQVALARTADEVEALHARGLRVVLLGMENAYPLGDTLDLLPMWAARGLRYVGLTHFGHNQFAGSSNPLERLGDADEDPGLSELGRALVAALNDHAILVDVSHVGKRSMLEATRRSRAPVIASHSGAHAVHANARNLDDEQLDAIRANGGVAQMVAFRSYVDAVAPEIAAGREALLQRHVPDGWDAADDDAIAAFDAGMADLRRQHPDVTLARFVDHIDHAVARIGIEHVGIASDFDGGGGVLGWDDASETVNVTRELLRRCYDEAQIRALWGGNVLRVLRAAEAAARPPR